MSEIHSEWLQLENGPRAWYARPGSNGPHPGVVIFIEAFGVNSHFQEVAERFAKAGYCAIVPDLYHGKVYEYADFDNAIGHLKTLKDDLAMQEAGLAIAELQKRPEVMKHAIGAVGFCMGGRFAFMANAVHADKLSAAVAFYGGGIAPDKDPAGRQPLLHLVEQMRAPLLLLYGADDHSITPEEHGRIAAALSTAKKRYTLTLFPGAPHGFFADPRDSYRPEAAAEGWRLTLDHFSQHLGGQA
ncbi:dienelactone hydrolase family protein [Acidithiobacillus concretivorus]|uniref:Dienelactone hydrolase family protein n=1 Tax=Acidithiobacillus concretivorus TaxID=3063952 RepID=A0ABS5ZNX8_9PROT|nr:dienelactone hydrolase family protein [Acidithiobacillus concretivorus]MBU2738313.1 dienelactone hydrolase family protein [Acidithiobacillus concretivorus]